MKKRGIVFVLSGILMVGGITGFAYANSKPNLVKEENKARIEGKLDEKEMIKIMKKNDFKDVAKTLEKKDYEAMDEFMNNMTDDDYQKMIEIMRKGGYESMANRMESISREDMIEMHNAMGGSESCHGYNNNMMGSF
ncbi:TMEM14 family protein [Tepidibacter hydrothermalis]|uniref:TMEM14 family protein n=1 Tax=Tepidibacter hydrothermalis TaxID=3036126 RepID=A0ABY8E9T5_9FIRM|nr:TMEM14 family protein [Tepidibacter hydrothermalis]WFD09663.1 TMEM14 family protein [Tepidibacter hydrothermalis]